MSQPDPDRIARIVSKLLDGVSNRHPAEQGVVFGELIVRLLELGLYSATPDDGSIFAAELNRQLVALGRRYNDPTVWQLVKINFRGLADEAVAPKYAF